MVTIRSVSKKRTFKKITLKLGEQLTSHATLNDNVHAPKWHLAYFVPIDGHFGQMFRDIDFTFDLPIIYIYFYIQTGHQLAQNRPDDNYLASEH